MKLFLVLLIVPVYSHCQDCLIDVTKDKFTDEIKISTQPIQGARLMPLSFFKSIKGKDTSFVMMFFIKSSVNRIVGKGLYVLFADNTKWMKKEQKIESKYQSNLGSYIFFTEIILSKKEVEKIKSIKITDIRLDNEDLEVENSDATMFKCAVNKVLKRELN